MRICISGYNLGENGTTLFDSLRFVKVLTEKKYETALRTIKCSQLLIF